jgi:hypothetical protein
VSTIYKYPLVMVDVQSIRLPRGARPLCVQLQDETPCLWVEVEPHRAGHNAKVFIVGTGHGVPNEAVKYLSTVQMGVFVWHFYIGEVLS